MKEAKMKKLLFLLLLIFLILIKHMSADSFRELPELLTPTSLVADDRNLYIADGTTVVICSLANGSRVKKFGTEGDGPGEFKVLPNLPITLHLHNHDLYVSSLGKVSVYSTGGIFKKEIRNTSLVLNPIPCGHILLGKGYAQHEGNLYFTVNIYDRELKKIREIHRERSQYYRGSNKKFDPIDATGPGIAVGSNRLFLNIGNNRDTIAVFDLEGNQLYAITHPFREIKLTGDHIKRYMEYLERDINFRDFVARTKHLFRFNKLFPLVQYLLIDGGKIFVISYENSHGKRDLYAFTLNGQFLKQLEIPLVSQNVDTAFPFTVYRGKLYQIVEDEEQERWQLFVHRIVLDHD
jgi:hypothetical protein